MIGPYRKAGLLYKKQRDHFGVNDDNVLVVQAPSHIMVATIVCNVCESWVLPANTS